MKTMSTIAGTHRPTRGARSLRAAWAARSLALLLFLTPSAAVQAQYNFTTLHSFSGGLDGGAPGAGLILSGNTLYGTTPRGATSSDHGTVFGVNTEGAGFTNLHSFSGGSDGGDPSGGLVSSGNTLYGTATGGGPSNHGTVFSVNADGTGFTTLYSFTGLADGGDPCAGLTLSGNTLYGTATSGGSSGKGTVFSVNTDGTGFTILYSFSGGSDGAYPYAGLILSGNTLFGTAANGGNSDSGTVFSVNTDGTGFTALYGFSGESDGANPHGGLILSGDTLYGTASAGGNSGYGTVFRVNSDGTGFTTLYAFTGPTDGGDPCAGLILSGNTLYGTAAEGGSLGYGTVFSLYSAPGSLDHFAISAISSPQGAGTPFNLKVTAQDADNNTVTSFGSTATLGGTAGVTGRSPAFSLGVLSNARVTPTVAGLGLTVTVNDGLGHTGSGSIAVVNPAPLGHLFRTLYAFSGGSDGSTLYSGLALSGTTLYGSTRTGGNSGNGTLFRIKTDGTGFTTLHSFTGQSDGSEPYDTLVLSGSTLYGTTSGGGSWEAGAVFGVNTDGTGFTTLHSLNGGSDGANPYAGLILSGNTLYGTAESGGNSGAGTVFAVNIDGTGFKTLYSFGPNDGANPWTGLALSGSTLYGTTANGGSSGRGTVFAVKTDGTGFKTLYSLGPYDGGGPNAVIVSGNTLYGTASGGGGTVFSLNTDGTGFTNLHVFNGRSDGSQPFAGLILSGNTLYGTASGGGSGPGALGDGTVFSVNTDGTGFTTLYTFTGGNDGLSPWAALVLSGDTLYGTTAGTAMTVGGTNYGTLFSLLTTPGPLDHLAISAISSPQTLGTPFPITITAQDIDNNTVAGFGGTVTFGGTAGVKGTSAAFSSGVLNTSVTPTVAGSGLTVTVNDGAGHTSSAVIAEVNPRRVTAQAFTTLHSFTGGSDGANPYAGLILSGNTLYGTAESGGSSGAGTVFGVNTDGTGFTVLHGFSGGRDGTAPEAGLILSGNTLYGTAESGGSSGDGTVFGVNTDGTGFTNLHSFTGGGDGANPIAGLILSGDTLYGSANGGGSSGNGTLFRINTDGTGFTNLHSFSGGSDGAYPYAGLILSGSTLYGTANGGGSSGYGTVFSVNTDGTGFTTLYSFTGGNDGLDPNGLILSGSALYGTAYGGGTWGNGTVFTVNTNGTGFTTLHSFTAGAGSSPNITNSDGAYPYAGLILSGNALYGTANGGGSSGYGTVFSVNTDGRGFATLHSFSRGTDGAYPWAGLVLSGNTLYGTAQMGGSSGDGTVFSLQLSVQASEVITWATPAPITYGAALTTNQLNATANVLGTFAYSPPAGTVLQAGGDQTLSVTFTPSDTADYTPVTQAVLISVDPALLTITANAQSKTYGQALNLGTTAFTASGLVNGDTVTGVTLTSPGAVATATVAGSPYPITASAAVGTGLGNYNISYQPGWLIVTAEPPGPAVFSLSSPTYSVLGNGGWVTVTVLRSPNSLGGTVNYSTVNGSAVAVSQGVGNYWTTAGSLVFAGSQGSLTVTIPIVANTVYEGNTTFSFVLSPSGDGSSLGIPSSATITIIDVNQPSTTNSVLAVLFPSPVPESDASLRVFTEPAEAGGQWKLVWEAAWHNRGDTITALPQGNYPVQFSPVAGFIAPATTTNVVLAGSFTVVTNQYAVSGQVSFGALSVDIQPSSLAFSSDPSSQAQWQLQGDTNWYDSDFVLTNLVAGNHIIVFKEVAGWVTPAPRVVYVGANEQNSIAVTYLVAGQSSGTPPSVLQFSDATSPAFGLPYVYNGQLLTDAGYGSGCVVQPRVVLTAAHVVFNDAQLSYVQNVNWFFQEFSGDYNPPAQVPAGWYVFSGYAAARTNDNSPGVESPASQDLDVAALYFLEDAGRGGSSGYLVSEANGTEWLEATALKTLVGYPVDDVPAINVGRMHATTPGNIIFTQVTNNVFATTAITGYPGNSGGPLCVQYTNGNYYPAGVYLGGTANTVVRAIDGAVADLINRANVTANTGANHVGGGVVTVTSGGGGSLLEPGSFQIILSPTGAIAAGAAWQIAALSATNYYSSNSAVYELPAGSYTVMFHAAAGYLTPTNATLNVVGGQTVTLNITYVAASSSTVPRLVAPAIAKGMLQLTITGTASEKVAIERSTNLVNWTAMVTNTIGAGGSVGFSDALSANRPRAFYRAQLIQ